MVVEAVCRWCLRTYGAAPYEAALATGQSAGLDREMENHLGPLHAAFCQWSYGTWLQPQLLLPCCVATMAMMIFAGHPPRRLHT